jgi:glycosyltransferase involved in cell wall biosynthesis
MWRKTLILLALFACPGAGLAVFRIPSAPEIASFASTGELRADMAIDVTGPGRMPKVLYIAPQSTHPVVNGAQVRVNAMVRHLCEDLGCEVHFFVPQGKLRREAWGPNLDRLAKIFIPRPRKAENKQSFPHLRRALANGILESLWRDIRDMVRPSGKDKDEDASFELLSHVNEALCAEYTAQQGPHPSLVSERLKRYDEDFLRDAVLEIVAAEKPDVIIVSYVWMSALARPLFDLPRRPMLICDTIDVQYMREARLQGMRRTAGFDAAREKALELELLGKYDLALAITDVDREELARSLAKPPVCTVMVECPVGEIQELTPRMFAQRAAEQHTYDLIFVGAANEANRYAAVNLLQDVVPKLQAARPDLTVAIAGRICEDYAVRCAAVHSSVKLLGYVKSVDDFYASGRVLAAPIPAGGGVKIKVLEAMAHAVAVVTTPIGAEGTPLEDGVHGYIVENSDAFVARALELLNDAEKLQRMSLAAQHCIRERLRPEAVYQDFDACLTGASRSH